MCLKPISSYSSVEILDICEFILILPLNYCQRHFIERLAEVVDLPMNATGNPYCFGRNSLIFGRNSDMDSRYYTRSKYIAIYMSHCIQFSEEMPAVSKRLLAVDIFNICCQKGNRCRSVSSSEKRTYALKCTSVHLKFKPVV